jgi:hypothetical protein
MTLLHLAPAIQEYLLFLAVSQASPISEAGLRRIAREPRWDRQRALFDSLLVGSEAFSTLGHVFLPPTSLSHPCSSALSCAFRFRNRPPASFVSLVSITLARYELASALVSLDRCSKPCQHAPMKPAVLPQRPQTPDRLIEASVHSQ